MIVVDGDVERGGMRALETLILEGICSSAVYCQQTDSTNSLALHDLRQGNILENQLPKCYLTDDQRAGRGRHGRTWVSSDGTLTFSLVIDRSILNSRQMGLASIAVGVGITRCLEFEYAPLNTRLKWPNDVHIGGGKVAGVLLETASEKPKSVVIGVGINVTDQPNLGVESRGVETRSLNHVVGREVKRYDLLSPLVRHILGATSDLVDRPDCIVEEFRERCLLRGQRIEFQASGRQQQGDCQGISEHGELIVRTTNGVCSVQSGEASLVRVR